jgi:hypothetical protein
VYIQYIRKEWELWGFSVGHDMKFYSIPACYPGKIIGGDIKETMSADRDTIERE